MKHTVIPILAITLSFSNCIGQTDKGQINEQTPKNAPVTNFKVNKQYDENGNIIRYDSTYSYYYSNIEGDTIAQDSIPDIFKKNLNQQFFFSDDPFFNDFFFQDTLIPDDFYHKDFFSNRYKNNTDEIDHIIREMDSIKNEFFNRQFKDSEPPKSNQPIYSL